MMEGSQNTTYYPSGGEEWVKKMGNISMTYYTNGFDSNNTHQVRLPASATC